MINPKFQGARSKIIPELQTLNSKQLVMSQNTMSQTGLKFEEFKNWNLEPGTCFGVCKLELGASCRNMFYSM